MFGGDEERTYKVEDAPAPRNEYGRAKFEGEKAVRRCASKFYIIRTSWVFGEYGRNFVYTMLKLAKTHKELNVVSDQIGRPTWTRTLAEFMIYTLENGLDYGTYHLSNEHSCSWYEFARAILKNSPVRISPVSSNEYPQKAWRPRHAVLDLSKTEATGFAIPTWKEALDDFMQELKRAGND